MGLRADMSSVEKKPQVNIMDRLVNHLFSKALPHSLAPATERTIKNIALALGLGNALAIIFNGYPLTMFLSLPFCIIWAYCAWLHHEPQLKWLNLTFLAIYAVGIVRYALHVGN